MLDDPANAVRGSVSGPDRMTRVAGALAEMGVVSLLARRTDAVSPAASTPDPKAELVHARQCDLPALLAQSAPGTEFADPRGSITLRVQPTMIEWKCPTEAAGRAFAAGLRPDSSPEPGAAR